MVSRYYQHTQIPRWYVVKNEYLEGSHHPWLLPPEIPDYDFGKFGKPKRILDFLRSVLQGYPLGMITVARLQFKEGTFEGTLTKEFLLDGFWRMMALYDATVTGHLPVYADVRKEIFSEDMLLMNPVQRLDDEKERPYLLPLNITMSARTLYPFQQELQALGHKDLSNRCEHIQNRLVDYTVPIQHVVGLNKRTFEYWVKDMLGKWDRYLEIRNDLVFQELY